MAQVLPLAVGAAISPVVLTALILLLAHPGNMLGRGLAFLAGTAVPLIVGAVLVLLFWHGVRQRSADSDRAAAIVDLAVGVLLLVWAVVKTARRSRPPRHSRSAEPSGRTGPAALLSYVGFGAVMMLINASTLALFLPAVKDVGNAALSVSARLGVCLLLLLVTLSPLIVTVGVYAISPARSARLLTPVGAWCQRHEHAIAVVVLVVFGGYLLLRGVSRL